MNIRDRIKELRRVPAAELRPNPRNWRLHPKAQADAMRGLLAEIGFAGAALARELDDGSLMLIDGHLRVEVNPSGMIPVLVLDVNEAEADKILATYDPVSAMAEADPAKLDAILREVETQSEDVAALLADLYDGAVHDLSQDAEIDSESGDGRHKINAKRAGKVKPVVSVAEVDVFERAMLATERLNRGEALMEICNAYLASK